LRHAVGDERAATRCSDESAVVGIRIQIALIGEVENVGDQSKLILLLDLEILRYASVPSEEPGLASRITGQQVRCAAADLHHWTIVVRELVDYRVAVQVNTGVSRIREPSVSDKCIAPVEAMGQVDDQPRLEL